MPPIFFALRHFSTRSIFIVTGCVIALLFAIYPPAKSAVAISSGDLIKGPTDAVYYYGQNGKRFVFPNAKTYFTWYTDFSTVKTISAGELASIPLGGNVTYRPGVKLVKIMTDPKVYAVAANGVLRWVKTEAVARTLHGLDWNKKVDDIPDAFFVNYTVGADIASVSDFSPSLEMFVAKDINVDKKLVKPRIYHGVSTHSWSNLITPGGAQMAKIKSEVDAYEGAVGRLVSWVAFGHEWKADGPSFPLAVATSIKNRGATPLIYLTLRSVDEGKPDPLYNLDAIISGQLDKDFIAWADEAKKFGSELIVDWGWEMNGDWAAWSGSLNGGAIEGPRRFRTAYRHIVQLMRGRGANNIRWAFHINFPEYPAESWNAFENYYPGDDVIDATGVSIYGAQNPTDEVCHPFVPLMDTAYARLTRMAPSKPIFVFEFATPMGHPLCPQTVWAGDALSGIFASRWPAVSGFAWWNDYWSQDSNPIHDTEMRVENLPELKKVFRSHLTDPNNVGDRPPVFQKTVVDQTQLPLKTLAEKRGLRFGAFYDSSFRGAIHDQIFEKEFNVMTAGIFWGDSSRPSRTEFDFTDMDTKVNFGRARGMDVHGHTLVWYAPSDLPDWFQALPHTEVEAAMNEHIDRVVGRYKGKIKVWDVVNEPVNDVDGALRTGHQWFNAMGHDYIRKAFVRAQAADPTAILRLSEYDIETNAGTVKFNGVKKLLKDLKSKGAPVHALGWQLHIKPGDVDANTLLARMNEIADLGFDNYITELDVELPKNATAADYEAQKQTYKMIVETFLKVRRRQSLVVWGLRDGSPEWATDLHPLLFDEKLNKKPAYFGVQEALK
jgi:GH35 family endo-1,4-beta-xylanase